MSLDDKIATPAAKRRYVRSLFATIADRYDLITVVLSYGRDRRWKERLTALAASGPHERALDLATGTGDIAFALASHDSRVVALDITERMIALARGKIAARRSRLPTGDGDAEPVFVLGDMIALPFAGASFDVVTTGYGLRNVPDLNAAIDEMLRVLKPGGCALSLDFNRPSNRLVRAAYLGYLTVAGGTLGWVLHRDPDTYRYIAASIRRYPGAEGVAAVMRERGFARVVCCPLLGGLMTIHHAFKR
jgi:demethylmenaquinone methyltransferase/2-methoxy-6-polyprenyl-1,4-benzoquinol methylase